MSKDDIVLEKPVEMVELSDQAMEAVAGGSFSFFSNNDISNSNLIFAFVFNFYFLGSNGSNDEDDD